MPKIFITPGNGGLGFVMTYDKEKEIVTISKTCYPLSFFFGGKGEEIMEDWGCDKNQIWTIKKILSSFENEEVTIL